MDAGYLKDFINTIIFLLPVLALVWKGAKLTSRLEMLEKIVKEKTEKFSSETMEIKKELQIEQNSRRSDTQTLMSALNDIQKSIVRLETKFDLEEKSK